MPAAGETGDIASAPPSAPGAGDLQHLLARASSRLADALGAQRVLIWERMAGDEPGAAPSVCAARVEGGTLCAPTLEEFEAVAALPAPTALTSASDLGTELAGLATRHGVAAAAPVAPGPDGARWVVLAGGGALDAGAVRPRQLAELAALCDRLATPTAAAAAAARLARLDASVRRLDRLAVLGGLVTEIVHEIRNPLVSVKTFLQLLPERGADAEFREDFGGLAGEELRRVERLLDVVLQHARPAADAPSEVELAESLDSVTRLVAHRAAERGVRLEVADADEITALPGVALPADALRQVLLNLVLNAIEASPTSSRVRITADLRSAGPSRAVEIRVEDEGPGVAPDQRERVFEAFHSTKPDRAGGLGLAISRRIAREAGGGLDVEAAPGGGACFRLRLPAP